MLSRLNKMLSAVALTAFCASASAQQAAPLRTILERHDQAGVAGKEIVLGTAELPEGTVVGWHVHHGDEAGYLLSGTLVLKTRGQPDRVLKAGDHFFNARDVAHSVVAEPGSGGGKAISTWIVDKGRPLAEPELVKRD